MMRLYYAKGASSLSPHIISREAGIPVELDRVDLTTMKTESGADYNTINEKGHVPALKLDNGEILTEGAVIVQYLADQKPDTALMPKAGTMERYRVQEWLNFIATDFHKLFSLFFRKDVGEEARKVASTHIARRFDYVSRRLKDRTFLLGEKFSVADAYFFTMLTWATSAKMDLARWPTLKAYHARVAARQGVQQALKEEGLELKLAA